MIDRPRSDPELLDNPSTEKSGKDPTELSPAELKAAGHFPDKLPTIIRSYCIACMGGHRNEVRNCHLTNCELWPYRMGTNPFAKRELTEEQREAARQRMADAREKRKVAA